MALCVSSWATPTTITWDSENGLTSIGLTEYTNLYWDETYHSYNEGTKTAMIGGVKVTISATADGSDASFSTYDNSTDLSVSNGATLTFSSSLYEIQSIVINFSNYGYATGWDGDENTLTWTGNATHSVEMADANVRGITSIVFTVEAIPTTTVTWNAGNGLQSIYITEAENAWGSYTAHDENKVATIDNVTVTASATTDGAYAGMSTYENNTSINMSGAGTLTFSSASSQFLQIVINFNSSSGYVNSPSEWMWNDANHTVAWSGNATNSVVLADAYIENITSIVFTLAAEEPAPADPSLTTITWDDTDLETLNISMSSGGKYMKDIIVKAAYEDVYEDNVYFMYQGEPANYCGFSMNNNGSLTFTPVSGTLTSIVINWNYEGPDPDLVPGSGWIFSNSALTWTSDDEDGAASVVLKSNSDAYLASGPISSIVFTVKDAAAPVDNPVTWTTPMVEIVDLYQSGGTSYNPLSVEMKGVTASVWAVEYGDYAHFMTSVDGINISVSNGGTLTFSSESEEFSSIVVNTNNGNGYGGSDGWVWDSEEATLTWTGEATNSVELANSHVTHITSIVFTFGSDEPVEPDTREVPELSFRNGEYELTETTIVRDCHDDIFEPGTYNYPSTEYFLYVNNGVMYYQDQPFIDWATPTEKGLTMTYSVPNNDVITLTKTSGNSFEFTVNGIGDAVVTASTEGNETYQPASITFTIHVEEGKAATKECVLKFIGGPNAGQFVPEDYKFEMETGEEFPWSWFELREKYYTEAVYAPSFTIWGSRNYYVACLSGELKLRALTAGDDMFTIQYARCEGGDMNNEYRLFEFPVHIKPTEIALTTSVDFTSDPSSNSAIANNATYNSTTQQVQIGEVISDEVVQAALTCYAFGHPGWDENLQNTISFELPQGTGSLKVEGTVQEGCVLKVKIRSENGVHSFTPTQVAAGEATIHYNVPYQTAVVIYISTVGGSPAPKRAPAAKKDEPKAALTALSLTPTYSISANVDPDKAGVYYSTHYNETQKYRLPVGTEAYAATISGSDMILNKVADGGQVIPANTAVILKSTSASIVLTPTDDAAVTVSVPNLLQGTDSEKTAPANCYVLSGKSTDNSVTGVGFYEFNGTLAAHKAYIIYGGGAGAPKRMRFIFNTPTGLENGKTQMMRSEKLIENGQLIIIKNGVRYNAQGQIVK